MNQLWNPPPDVFDSRRQICCGYLKGFWASTGTDQGVEYRLPPPREPSARRWMMCRERLTVLPGTVFPAGIRSKEQNTSQQNKMLWLMRTCCLIQKEIQSLKTNSNLDLNEEILMILQVNLRPNEGKEEGEWRQNTATEDSQLISFVCFIT